MTSLKLHVSLLLSATALLTSCTSFQTSDWQASITLPATLDCYSFNVMSGKETRIAADDPKCIEKKVRSVYLDFESYKLLKKDIQKNCQYAQCKQITGAFDGLFLTIDSALKKIPTTN